MSLVARESRGAVTRYWLGGFVDLSYSVIIKKQIIPRCFPSYFLPATKSCIHFKNRSHVYAKPSRCDIKPYHCHFECHKIHEFK